MESDYGDVAFHHKLVPQTRSIEQYEQAHGLDADDLDKLKFVLNVAEIATLCRL